MVPFSETVEYIVVLRVLMGIYGQAPRNYTYKGKTIYGLHRPAKSRGQRVCVSYRNAEGKVTEPAGGLVGRIDTTDSPRPKPKPTTPHGMPRVEIKSASPRQPRVSAHSRCPGV